MSKVIFKLTFKHPNLKDTKSKNISHINYISMRPGVDKSLTEADLTKELDKGIENINVDDLNSSDDSLNSSDDSAYIKYINERPRSHGLFGPNGIEDPKEVQDELSNVSSFVWRGIISLKEDDAKHLGYLDKQKWEDMLRKKIPDMAKEMDIKTTNLRWVAAVHMEKGHPHTHVMFWEKNPERVTGTVSTKKLDNIRKAFTDEIFEEERLQIFNEKNIMRDLIRDLAKGDVSNATKIIRDIQNTELELKSFISELNQEGVPPRLYSFEEQELANKIAHLAYIMPGKGRVALKFMPENVKKEVKDISEYLLQRPVFSASLEKNLNAIEELTRLYTSDEKAINNIQDQYLYIINNMANTFLKYDVPKDHILKILKDWTNKYNSDINISIDDINSILAKIKFDNNFEFKSDNEKDIFNGICIKLSEILENSDSSTMRQSYIQNELNSQNELLNSMLDKGLIYSDEGTYFLTDKTVDYLNINNSLNSIQRDLIKLLLNKELNINELLENKHINYILDNTNKQSNFMLKKYDATIIREYFGKNNNLNFIDLKRQISDKFNLESKQNNEFNIVTKRISTLVKNNIVTKDGDNYSFTDEGLLKLNDVNKYFEFTSYDANVLFNYIERANGSLSETQLKNLLSEEYKTKSEIGSQLKYILNRIENNISEGYVKKGFINGTACYSITDKGLIAKENIINPNVSLLKNNLKLLVDKNIILINNDKYLVNQDFILTLNNTFLSNIKDNKFDGNKIKEDNNNLIQGINNRFNSIDISYASIKHILKLKNVDDPIANARNKAYKDIVNRVSQVVLKGAAESQKLNTFFVNPALANKAVYFIANITNKINLIPEQTRVLNEISAVLINTGHTDEQIIKSIIDFSSREKLNIPYDYISDLVRFCRENFIKDKNINFLSSYKNVKFYVSVLKSAGYNYSDIYSKLKDTIKNNSLDLRKELDKLKDDNILQVVNNNYKLTNNGVDEFLKTKKLDKSDKEIFKAIQNNNYTDIPSDFNNLIGNKEIFSSLRDTDPEEFKISKYDLFVRDQFGDNNKITFKELHDNIISKYNESNTNIDKAESEFDALKARIEKLALNGYITFNKETGIYSFTADALEKLNNLSDKMEFSKYDANVTLKYIDNAPNNILTEDNLRNSMFNEITNTKALSYYDSINKLFQEDNTDILKNYINIDPSGILTSTEDGKFLSFDLSKLNKYFYMSKGNLTDKNLKELCIKEFGYDKAETQFKNISTILHKHINQGTIKHINGVYKIDPVIRNINNLLYQIYKEGGTINKSDLRAIIEKNVPNEDAERQFKYVLKRLEFLKKDGYLEGQPHEYKITILGREKRDDLLVPQRDLLRNKLNYLSKLGFLNKVDGNYNITEKYYNYVNNSNTKQTNNIDNNVIPNEISAVIDKTHDNVDVGKIERTNMMYLNGIYMNDDYNSFDTDYLSMRDNCNVPDIKRKTLHTLSTALIVSGVDIENTKQILYNWNTNSESNIESEEIDDIVEDAYEDIEENNLWGDTTVISKSDWNDAFKSLGVNEKDIPKWIYSNTNSIDNNMFYLVNDVWKSIWAQLEKQRLQTEAQVKFLNKQLIRQQAISNSKESIKEQIIKNKDKGSLYQDYEFE